VSKSELTIVICENLFLVFFSQVFGKSVSQEVQQEWEFRNFIDGLATAIRV